MHGLNACLFESETDKSPSDGLDNGTNLEALGAEGLSFDLLTSAGTDDDEGDDKEDTGLTFSVFSGKPEVGNASRKRSLVGSAANSRLLRSFNNLVLILLTKSSIFKL